jgi:ABC-2 type transport system permease protein
MRNIDKDRWESFLRYKPNIRFNYVYYYDSIPDPEFYKRNNGKSLRQIAEDYASLHRVDINDFKTPAEIRKMVDLRTEQGRYVMQLKLNGKSTFLRLFDDNLVFPSEAETAAALQRMTRKLPKVAFLQDEMEYSAERFGDRSVKTLTGDISFRYALINQGFDVASLSLKNQEVPADISVLAIVDPQRSFDTVVLNHIRHYLDRGGNLLIAAEPGKQDILQPLLQPLGVQLMKGAIVQPSRELSPNLALTWLTPEAARLSRKIDDLYADSTRVAMPGLTGLLYTGNAYEAKPLLVTDAAHSWMQMATADSTSQVFTPPPATSRSSIPAALALTRQLNDRQQRIIVTGDANFLNIFNMRRDHLEIANYHFNTRIFGWLSHGGFPIEPDRPKSKDDHAIVTQTAMNKLKWLFMGVVPALLAIACGLLLAHRKRR